MFLLAVAMEKRLQSDYEQYFIGYLVVIDIL